MPADRDSSSATSGKSVPNGTTTRVVTKRVEPAPPIEILPDGTPTSKYEEWTTSRKIVNHKTRQVETRVQRQLVYEDGKVVADSGPQISTKTTEDNRKEETENTDHKSTGGENLGPHYIADPGSVRVITEKTESRQTTREKKEENVELHDEGFRELTGTDLHQKALGAPDHELFSREIDVRKPFPGKVTHYSCRGQKVTDKEEVNEVSEWKDGEMTTETTTTRHHEEQHDEEVPEDETDESAMPEISTETINNIEYYGDNINQESLTEKLKREKKESLRQVLSSERQDEVSKTTVDVEQEDAIKKIETNHWVKSHFGSNNGNDYGPATTKTAKNVIHIQLVNNSKPPSCVRMDKNLVEYRNTSKCSQEESLSSSEGWTCDKNKHFLGVSEWDSNPRRLSEVLTSSSPSHKENTKSISPANSWKDNSNYGSSIYLTTTSSPKCDSTSLRKHSNPWRSTSVIRDDFCRTSLDDQKEDSHTHNRHEPFHSNNNSFDRSKIHGSHSPRDTPRMFTMSDESGAPRNSSFVKEDFDHTLPRDTKFKSEPYISYFYTSVKSSPQDSDRKDSGVQVDLLENSHCVTLPWQSPVHPLRVFDERDIQTLPRAISKNPQQEQTKHVAARTPRSFYFGDECDISFHNDSKNKIYQSQNFEETNSHTRLLNLNNGNLEQPDGHYTIEQKVKIKDNPQKSSILLNTGDLKSPHYKTELDCSTDDNFGNQNHYCKVMNSDASGRKDSYHHNIYSNITHGNNQNGNDVTITSVSHEKRKEFMQGLLDSATPENDIIYSIPSKNDMKRRQHQCSPPPPLPHIEKTSSTPPPSLTKVDYSPSESEEEAHPRPIPPPPAGGLFDNNTLPKFRSEKSPISAPVTKASSTTTLEIKGVSSNAGTTLSPNNTHHERGGFDVPVRPPRRPKAVVVEVRDWDNR
ncbi:uncharacterized protein LOC106474839 [Limulus polyphemus]|uniref:Uncharacterized protein LOC106474839 n=1 Tax=Limulus polyphemus TaxID=6850 RepID=A0ABM1BYB2_LIMPO|nr:uncharacterized protein LOC106474839 [Limulus polyphemus]